MQVAHRRRRPAAPAAALAAAALLSLYAVPARAGSFDALGEFVPDPHAVVLLRFDDDIVRYLPEGAEQKCVPPMIERVEAADALEGATHLRVNALSGCAERLLLSLPASKGSYRASLWLRHGSLDAQVSVLYPARSGLDSMWAKLFPTGRVTSDGWVELGSNDLPVDGAQAEAVVLRLTDYADRAGVDVDAFELVPSGSFVAQRSCLGARDPVCGADRICVHERCRLGRLFVPPLPAAALRNDVVDVMQSELRVFFGGRKTRLEDLPASLAILDSIRQASDPWTFWNGWAMAIRRLHDWHTHASSGFPGAGARRRLNACFIEGEGDLSQQVWPRHPKYADLLVSHVGEDGTQGLKRGDRLVAVDGQHPIEWALGLIDVDWGRWQASDSAVFAELAERMRDLIVAYAKSFTVVRCDAGSQSCGPAAETVLASELTDEPGGQVACDNRPLYHLGAKSPKPDHGVWWQFFRGPIEGTSAGEAIYGLVWDTLYGGEPNSWVHKNLSEAFAEFRQKARGVILDHRAGNGGTLDGAEHATALVRPKQAVAVIRMPIATSGFDGPANPAEGIAIFEKFKEISPYVAGADDWDPDLPVAVLLHRDGSASDYFPFGMKGAKKARLFAPHATAGGFSTYVNYVYWGGLSHQIASGDTIAFDGRGLIGHGVEPDVQIEPRQSDLLAGKDTLHEAALAWVRQELKKKP
ncbi:MAG: hypothetical protein HY744_02185 [Deltaproteobacteria bacterium]|nr:hypothetical protein [Deltaproteobacteria bacterium]